MKYNLAIINVGQTLMIVLLLIAWAPLSSFIIYQMNSSFLKEHALIAVGILLIPPICIFAIWLRIQKYKDVFEVTERGIETVHHGIIKWGDFLDIHNKIFIGFISRLINV